MLITRFQAVLAAAAVAASRDLVVACARELGLDYGLRHRCPHCGGVSHGRPLVYLANVSLSRAPGLVLAAATDGPPIGVDLEQVGAVSASMARRIRHPEDAEPDLTRLWVAKEAATKAWGVGLRADFREVLVAEDRVIWRGHVCSLEWLAAPTGYLAAVARG